MPSNVQAVTVGADGTAEYDFGAAVPTGVNWIASQVSVEIVPTTTQTVTARVRLNGRLITATNQGSGAGAGGYPFFIIRSGDKFVVSFANAPVGSSAVMSLFYNERAAAQSDIVGVV